MKGSTPKLGKQIFVIVDHVLAADDGGNFHHDAELRAPGCEMGKQLFIAIGTAENNNATFPWCVDAEQEFKTVKFVFLGHGTTFPEFDEQGIGSLLEFNIFKLAVNQIELHDALIK